MRGKWKKKIVFASFILVGIGVLSVTSELKLIDNFAIKNHIQAIHTYLAANLPIRIEDWENQNAEFHKQEWLTKRQELLKTSPRKKVLLFCYMRGGSTFFSELFHQNKDVLFFYEPLDAFYSATYGLQLWNFPQDIFWYQHGDKNSTLRTIPDWEMDALVEFNHNLLTLNVSGLPVDMLAHRGFRKTNLMPIWKCLMKYSKNKSVKDCRSKILPKCNGNIAESIKNNCAENIRNAVEFQKGRTLRKKEYIYLNDGIPGEYLEYADCKNEFNNSYISACLPQLINRYTNSKIVAYKGLRITMDSVGKFLERDPDMHIIYFVRDPRSMVTSRDEAHLLYRDSADIVSEAGYLCEKYIHDYKVYKVLNDKYPGAIKLITYENLTLDRYTVLEETYKFLGMPVHDSVYEWMKKNEEAVGPGDRYSTVRTNSSASIDKWRKHVNISVQHLMTERCKVVLDSLGYPY